MADTTDRSVVDEVRRLESEGVDAHRIEVTSPIQGTRAETQRTGGQLGRPLGRALIGFAVGISFGLIVGAIIGLAADLLLPGILLGAIAGALLGGLNALYSRLPMSSTAFDADGASNARVEVHDSDD